MYNGYDMIKIAITMSWVGPDARISLILSVGFYSQNFTLPLEFNMTYMA
jgi:hypothetical protein